VKALGTAIVAIALLSAPGTAAAELLGDWRFNEGSGQIAQDSSGAGNTGQLGELPVTDASDPTWIPGRLGSGLRFDGASNQFVGISPSTPLPQRVTVAAWVRRLGTPGRWRYIVSSGGSACAFASFGLYSGFNGGISFYVSDDGGYVTSPVSAPGAVWDGSWHLATGTYDGQRVRLYIDGAPVGSGTPAGLDIFYVPTEPLRIGTYRGTCDRPFTGDIDDVAIHSRALSDAEVAASALDAKGQSPPRQVPPIAGPPAGRPPAGCLTVRVTPGYVVANRRTRLRVAVRRQGRGVANRRVILRGPGLKRTVRTGRRGYARLVVRPRRRGTLRVSVPGQPRRCNARRVLITRPGA
jgi:hypothetical protein